MTDQSNEARLLREALTELAEAEAAYRKAHDFDGDGSLAAGRAWDRMRRAGDKARATLAARFSTPPLDMCAHGADRGTYCGQCRGYSQGGGSTEGLPSNVRLRRAVGQAIFDPGATEGFKGERSLTDWQTHAAMRVVDTELNQIREALDKYGAHKKGCNVARALPFEIRSGTARCTCGFDEVRGLATLCGGE